MTGFVIAQVRRESKDLGAFCGEFAGARFNSFSRRRDRDSRTLGGEQTSRCKADPLRTACAGNEGHLAGKVQRFALTMLKADTIGGTHSSAEAAGNTMLRADSDCIGA